MPDNCALFEPPGNAYFRDTSVAAAIWKGAHSSFNSEEYR